MIIQKLNRASGVYYLTHDNEIVYVGSSRFALKRILQHTSNPDMLFDGYYIDECSESDMHERELQAILDHTPKYNKKLPLDPRYLSKGQIKDKFGLDGWQLNRLLKSIHPFATIGDTEYFLESDCSHCINGK